MCNHIRSLFYQNDTHILLLQTFVQTRDKNAAIPRNAQLATSAEREVPRATCNERGARSSPRNLQQARSAKFPAQLATSAKREVPRAETASVSHYTARRKRRTVYPQKELQSAFMPFMTSERMSYKNLRTDKRKTFRHFLTSNSGAISDRVFYHASFLFVRRLISHTAS